jgi:hypothetical protein
MMREVQVKLNSALPWQKQHLATKNSYQQIVPKFKEASSQVLRLDQNCVRC